ncbi:unnamed protein product [Cyprideis torosa]|uniref:Decapping nuclease n=1 Tax=Cyprideis torosa TaxID=163714 RepID=A0A7R8WLM3_9CRUS|nr:unnamed protein product [Cyprideis torosa]CAG0904485.1 unnamed protein product [Cyprideis torosa]
MKWWAQSYLVGIPRIICGYRNEDGIVRGLEDFNTMTMHRLGKGFWQPNIPMVFALRMLDFIQSCLPHDDPNKQLAFIWTPGEPVKCYDVSGQVEVLPQWYLEMTES